MVEGLFLIDGRKDDIAAYKNALVVSPADFVSFSQRLKTLATQNSGVGQIIGTDNTLTTLAAKEMAQVERLAIQRKTWSETLKVIFQTAETPYFYNAISVNNKEPRVDYKIISEMKDFTIPNNFNNDRDFIKVRRFFQMLAIKYGEADRKIAIDFKSDDIEETVSSSLSERDLMKMAKRPTLNGVLDYINRIGKKSEILNTRLINFSE